MLTAAHFDVTSSHAKSEASGGASGIHLGHKLRGSISLIVCCFSGTLAARSHCAVCHSCRLVRLVEVKSVDRSLRSGDSMYCVKVPAETVPGSLVGRPPHMATCHFARQGLRPVWVSCERSLLSVLPLRLAQHRNATAALTAPTLGLPLPPPFPALPLIRRRNCGARADSDAARQLPVHGGFVCSRGQLIHYSAHLWTGAAIFVQTPGNLWLVLRHVLLRISLTAGHSDDGSSSYLLAGVCAPPVHAAAV